MTRLHPTRRPGGRRRRSCGPFLRAARGAALALALGAALACASTLETGERHYRAGDRLAALETWRSIREGSLGYDAAQERIAEVEAEFAQLVVRHRQQGRYYERNGRLAESVLSYRLALKLQPEDHETLDRVQHLARELATQRAALRQRLTERFQAGDLPEARAALIELHTLDPFARETSGVEHEIEAALDAEVERWMAEGRAGFERGSYRHAEAAFRRVLDYAPDDERARGYLAYIERNRERARALSDAFPSVGPAPTVAASDAEIRAEGYHQHALTAAASGNDFAAISFELEALGADPSHPGAKAHLAQLRARLAPQVPVLLEQGRVRYQQEDLRGALDQWRRALLVEPGNEQATEYAARAERLLENLERLRDEPLPQVGTGQLP